MKNLLLKLSIRMKLIIGFSIVIFLVVASNVFNIISLNDVNKDMKTTMNSELPLLIADESIAANMAERTSLLQGYLLSGDETYRTKFEEGVEESIALENKILELTDSESAKELIDKKFEWGTLTDKVFVEWDKGNKEEALRILTDEIQPLEDELINGFKEMSIERESEIKKSGTETIENGDKTILFSSILTIVVILVGVLIAIVSSSAIIRPIKRVMERMQMIGAGDLSQEPLPVYSSDEIGQLAQSMNELQEELKTIMKDISLVSETVASHSEELTQSAGEVSAGAEQISATMQDLASGSEKLASNSSELATIASSFTEKTEEAKLYGQEVENSSKDVLTMTNEGRALMNSSSEQMEKINAAVTEVVEKVTTLHGKSKNISKLIDVINKVASDTKLLGFNANIIAAKAGDSGREFSVVADEVKSLSSKTEQSAVEIAQIIEEIQNLFEVVLSSLSESSIEVGKGTEQIEETNKTFKEINEAVGEVVAGIQYISTNLTEVASNSLQMNESVHEIAAISQESSAGIEETSAATQQTGSSMEEVTGSSEELAKLAQELNDLVNKFTLD